MAEQLYLSVSTLYKYICNITRLLYTGIHKLIYHGKTHIPRLAVVYERCHGSWTSQWWRHILLWNIMTSQFRPRRSGYRTVYVWTVKMSSKTAISLVLIFYKIKSLYNKIYIPRIYVVHDYIPPWISYTTRPRPRGIWIFSGVYIIM